MAQQYINRFFAWLAKEESVDNLIRLSFILLSVAMAVNVIMFPFAPEIEPVDIPAWKFLLIFAIAIPTLPLEELIFRGPLTWFARQEPGNIRLLFLVAVVLNILFALIHHNGQLVTLAMQGVTGLMMAIIYLKAGGANGKFKKPFIIASFAHIAFDLAVIPVAFVIAAIGMLFG